ncbi:unnamed protein product [Diamesa hyperborea]
MRRRAGIGAIQKQKLEAEKYKDKGTEISDNQFEQMTKQMETLRENLENFATKHKNEIKKDSKFRRQFQDMCSSIGVDPLASGKGVWSVLGISDFYYELSVQVVEVCLSINHITGGMIELTELRDRLVASRGQNTKNQDITSDDILIAAKKLRIFGNSFVVHPVGKNRYIVQSIPGELNLQETQILSIAADQENGFVTSSIIIKSLGWTEVRTKQALNKLLSEGLVWIDTQDEAEPSYWFPSLYPGRK